MLKKLMTTTMAMIVPYLYKNFISCHLLLYHGRAVRMSPLERLFFDETTVDHDVNRMCNAKQLLKLAREINDRFSFFSKRANDRKYFFFRVHVNAFCRLVKKKYVAIRL